MPAPALRQRSNGVHDPNQASVVPVIPKIAVNNQIRLAYYFRSAQILLRQVRDLECHLQGAAEPGSERVHTAQAEMYRTSHDDRQLFTMLMRFARCGAGCSSLLWLQLRLSLGCLQPRGGDHAVAQGLQGAGTPARLCGPQEGAAQMCAGVLSPPQQGSQSKHAQVLTSRYLPELEQVKLALQLSGQEASPDLHHQQGLAPNTQQLTTSALPQVHSCCTLAAQSLGQGPFLTA